MNNSRLVAQQAVTTASNLSDIESYILENENRFNAKFITAIDIKANERDLVMQDLRYMGITAGSMIPTIAGVCEDLKERNF